jgi:hypothetical protein
MTNERGHKISHHVVPTHTPMFYKLQDSRAVLFVDAKEVYRAGTSHQTEHGNFYLFDRSMWKRVGSEAVLEKEVISTK